MILVFQGGSAMEVMELASQPDSDFLQGYGEGVIGFSRAIGVASPKYIREHGWPKSRPPDHDGVDDGFLGKASVVWYLSEGSWQRLPGAD